MNRRDFLKTVAVPAALVEKSAKSCIFLKLVGGPSQLDTWDPKPDAPSRIRSPYRPIRTNVPGIEISELFPRMARHADKYALIRSCYHTGEPVHGFSGWGLSDCGTAAVRKRACTSFEQSCKSAVRAVASGQSLVVVNMFHSVHGQPTWDGHGFAPFSPMAAHCDHAAPMFDIAYSMLLAGLQNRDLLKTTLVVASGEFGRTPRINPAGGRDHWSQCWTLIMAGGGVQGGQVIGSSDAIAAEPKDRPVSIAEIAATIRYARGLPATSAQPVMELFR